MKKYLLPALFLLPLLAHAQTQTLRDAAQAAVQSNPEVQAKWHAFLAANGERDVAAGGFLPRLDAQAGAAREEHNDPLLVNNYNSRYGMLSLSQMLYDGFATSNDVARLDHNRLARLYELYDTTESTVLDVVHAHLDVLRYRRLVSLAEDNYVQHRAVYDQIQQKAKAGVGRRVDLEQSAGRLALAEANLLTETSNLHDVSARFQRLVGITPARELEEPAGLERNMPADVLAAMQESNRNHPAVLAAIESIRAADSERKAHKGAYQPRIDLRLTAQHGTNINSEPGETNDKTAQIVLTWNLFNGFSDRAKLQQLAEQINVGRDLRDKVCRDVRQNLEISYNDVRKITELLSYLDQHQLSTEKARDAYHQQFDIGQRTLLDLLDSENELFEAKRAYIEAEYDQLLAYARVQAGVGNLFKSLGLTRQNAGPLPDFGTRNDETEATHCEVEAPQTYVADKRDLNTRAEELMRESAVAAPVAKPATVSKDDIAITSKAATGVQLPTGGTDGLEQALNAWRSAWAGQDVETYLASYAANFKPDANTSHEDWAAKRKTRVSGAQHISLEIGQVKYEIKDATHARTSFHQSYRADSYHDEVDKQLEWQKAGGRWLIVGETSGK